MSELKAPGVLPGGGGSRDEMLPRPFVEQGGYSRLRHWQCEEQISDGSRLCSSTSCLLFLRTQNMLS